MGMHPDCYHGIIMAMSIAQLHMQADGGGRALACVLCCLMVW